MSACKGFSTCRIQFIPNDQQRADRNYSDRSLIELRQYDFASYSLRALDIENNKDEIFNIPLKNDDQYRRGKSGTYPDEIRSTAGTYRLWLNAASRTKFHEALNSSIEELKLLDHESPEPPTTPPDTASKSNLRRDEDPPRSNPRRDEDPPRPNPRRDEDPPRSNLRRDEDPPRSNPRRDENPPRSNLRRDEDSLRSSPRRDQDPPKSNLRRDEDPPRPNPRRDEDSPRSNSRRDEDPPRSNLPRDYEQAKPTTQSNRNDILADVYQLGQHIRQGHVDDAVNLAKKLSKKHVQLQANIRKQQGEEKSIEIRVKIDSNDQKLTRQYDEFTMDVYPSTTIHELRTAFAYSEKFPLLNQYFFVNGHLAHDNSTMKELDIRPNLLFVLFIIQ